eukprot:TRINITY_DN41641_c0_g1_i1.p1 TRINITY_DN41641_c0_g1~~TRINITY_DN41641_c0_g1_i1.p1  ORF type:complete len:478 (-),score=116.89 TRINITY_DN41641_c0_g1_i1:10-1443(-)
MTTQDTGRRVRGKEKLTPACLVKAVLGVAAVREVAKAGRAHQHAQLAPSSHAVFAVPSVQASRARAVAAATTRRQNAVHRSRGSSSADWRLGTAAFGVAFAAAGLRAHAVCRATRTARQALAANVAGLDGPKMRLVVFGGTGYIGRAAVVELAARGHSVVVCTRPNSGIGGKQSVADVKSSFNGLDNITVKEVDVSDQSSLNSLFSSLDPPAQGAVCCLASRSGGREDSFAIDYQATVNCVEASRKAGLAQFVLLSAVCVQRPLLAFQEAKLKAEAELRREGESMAYSIVQPTAFFKSLLGQVKGVKGGSPYVMFGDGTSVRCKPISEEDLASFMADCFWDAEKKNKTLPIGGPGKALSFKEQGELLFSLVGREPNFICVPYAVFDFVQAILDFIAGLFPGQSDLAEFGRIGRYYAEQSMLVLDPATGKYSEELTPSYGRTDLRAFLTEALEEGSTKMESQQLGAQGVGSRIGLGED